MNALRLPQPPDSPRSRRAKSNRDAQPSRQRVLAAEATIKIGVNVLISSAAIAALVQLVPYSVTQQTKLKEIHAEVNAANNRVDRLKAEFGRYFDPHQTKAIVQEQTNRSEPNQKVVVWGDSEPPVSPAAQAPN